MKLSVIFFVSGMLTLLSGPFTVETEGDHFVIRHRGQVLFDSVQSYALDRQFGLNPQCSTTTLPDGTRVWNKWSEAPETRIRQEIALAPDGSQVEISMMGSAKAFDENQKRTINLTIPWKTVENMTFEGLAVNGRRWEPASGHLTPDTTGSIANTNWRYFCLSDGQDRNLVFDLNPIGAGDYIMMYKHGCIRGVWTLAREKDKLLFVGGTILPDNPIKAAGTTGAKIVIREGKMDSDYFEHHALKSYKYGEKLVPVRLYSFGAAKHGKQFQSADAGPYNVQSGFGWLDEAAPQTHIASPEGAYYASCSGKNASFQMTGVIPGIHFVTITSGNFSGIPNHFSVTVNGKEAAPLATVPKGKLQAVTIPVRVHDGTVIIKFNGDFLVSTIAMQPIIAKAEDFSFDRGFWVTKGYESGELFQSADYPPVNLARSINIIDLPTPGQEATGPMKPFQRPVEQPNPHAPELAWIPQATFRGVGDNSSDWTEYTKPEYLQRHLDNVRASGGTVLMMSGLLSRHTYPTHRQRILNAIRQYANAAHAAGLKAIDHNDATLLWNCGAGFRVMAERTPELVYDLRDMTPNSQFCILNPTFTRTYRNYLLDIVKAGVDGLQCDELTFYPYGCGCQHCREAFHKDTGWQLPMNELDSRLYNPSAPLWKAFLAWRMVKVANWWVEFRREAKALNPHLTLCMYSTHGGFTSHDASLRLGLDLTEEARAINFFGTEIMTRNCLYSERALLPYRKMKNLLRLAYGTPIWAWIYGSDHPGSYFGWAACNMTAQCGVDSFPIKQGEPDYRSFQTSPDNIDRANATSVANVALLFSRSSRDWNSDQGMVPELFGLAQVLERMHVQYDFIGEMSLTPQTLKKYRFLAILGDGCISKDNIEVIRDFARKGGNVYLSTISSQADELGTRYAKWPFADIFGFSPKRFTRMDQTELGFKSDGTDAIRPIAPRGAYALSPAPSQEKTLVYSFDSKRKPLPALVEQPFGKGKLLYQSVIIGASLYAQEGTVGQDWRYRHDPVLEDFYKRVLSRILADSRWWQTDAPDRIHTTIFRQPGALSIHFLNGAASNLNFGEKMPEYCPKIAWPPLSRDITFTIPCDKATQVYAVSPEFKGRKLLDFNVTDGKLTAKLPKELLHAYTIVWVK